MAKPIFLIAVPYVSENFEQYIQNVQQKIQHVSEQLSDYHVLYYVHRGEELTFQTFYEKDFNQIKYEELKQMIQEKIENLKSI